MGTLVVDVLHADVSHGLRRHSVNSSVKLPQWHTSTIVQHLSADVLTALCGAVDLVEELNLQLFPCSLHLKLCSTGAQSHPFSLQVEYKVIDVHSIGNEICAPESGVVVADVEVLKAVTQLHQNWGASLAQ